MSLDRESRPNAKKDHIVGDVMRHICAVRSGLLSTFVHGAGLVFRLAFMLLLLRFSDSAVLGYYGLLVSIELVVIYGAGFEFHTFTTRRYARRPSASKLHVCLASHRRMLLVSAPFSVLLTLAAIQYFELSLSLRDTVNFAIVVLSGVIAQEVIRYMVLVNKPVHAVLVTFIRGALWQPFVVPFIAVAAADADIVSAIVVGWAAFSVFGALWGLFVLRSALGFECRPRWRYLLHGLKASRSYYVTAVASVMQGNLERFVLQLLLGPAAVGAFSFFQSLANTLPALIQSAILNISLARLLTAFGKRVADRMQSLREVLTRSFKASLLIAVLICLTSIPLVWLTSQSEYVRLLWILPLLLVGQVLTMWTQPIHLALYGAHRDRTLMILSLIVLCGSVILNYGMVRAFGFIGAVLSPLFVGIALSIARWRLLRALHAAGHL